ncbi:MAG: glycosyltransferase [Gammaproteobacteria bacterium]|nr:glycosyltransferase [Gammaproteobacteria bacterium]
MSIDYSIIIPAWNEAKLLPKTLDYIEQSMSQQQLSGEIIVVDNNSSDETAALAAAHGATVVFEPINQISRARNRGVTVANGRYLIFVDADTLISPQLLRCALDNLDENRCCGGGATVSFGLIEAPLARYLVKSWNWLATRLGLAAGCFIYTRADAYEAIGGFSEQVYASEEIWLSRDLRRWGKKHNYQFCIISDYQSVSSARKMEWFGPFQQLLLLLMLLIFPYAVRFRRLCNFWYKRPE